MSKSVDISPIRDFLLCETPIEWVNAALHQQDVLLVDHANCEKKAASTALNLMYRYVEHGDLLSKLSRLAREELRHFEQVLAIMQARAVEYPQLTASRYAQGLHTLVRKPEPGRLIDTLIVGAIIEARSCERFAALAPHLDEELSEFYTSLLRSESRHFRDYLKLAQALGSKDEVDERLPVFLAAEKALIENEDEQFRFHSGPPVEVS
ncbi:MAG: tRNA-(ms[2]io[6]A)-hydroxylase [Halioglobus sp.]